MILDEPSTGLDPAAKKILWTVLTSIRMSPKEKSSAIVLSTHDMTEAETVADCVGIISKGRILTQGSVPELINKHCAFIQCEVVFQPEKIDQVEAALVGAFEDVVFAEKSVGKLRFRVRQKEGVVSSVQMAEVFEELAKIKKQELIAYYLVKLMNLEQIFLAMTREQ